MNFKRRDLLKASAAIAAASAAGGFSCIEIASAAPVSPPVVDRLSVRVLVDGANNLFLRPGEANGAKIEPPPRAPDSSRLERCVDLPVGRGPYPGDREGRERSQAISLSRALARGAR